MWLEWPEHQRISHLSLFWSGWNCCQWHPAWALIPLPFNPSRKEIGVLKNKHSALQSRRIIIFPFSSGIQWHRIPLVPRVWVPTSDRLPRYSLHNVQHNFLETPFSFVAVMLKVLQLLEWLKLSRLPPPARSFYSISTPEEISSQVSQRQKQVLIWPPKN